jgi:hypothetical protein
LCACTKVVKLDLRTAAGKYVVEGEITDGPGPYVVRISESAGFYTENKFSGVGGATVRMWDDASHAELLTDAGGGVYTTSGGWRGVSGRTYYLRVVIGADSFFASSTMPSRVSFDSLTILPVLNGGKTVLTALPWFRNPVGPALAYYRFNQTINGSLDKSLYYWDNAYTAGQENTFSLERNSSDSTLHVGDTVKVEMQCIDKALYDYWQSMDAAAVGAGGAYPGNPVTNLSGGALGYFSAHTEEVKGVKVR